MVNFRGPNHTFKYYSAVDIYNGNFDPSELEGKVALIGTTAAGLNDIRAIPFEPVYPGVEVHANIIDNIIARDFLYLPAWIDGANIMILFLLVLITTLLVTYTPLWVNPIIMTAMIILFVYGAYYNFAHYGIIFETFLPILAVITATLIATFMDYFYEIRKEYLIKEKICRQKVSKEVMENPPCGSRKYLFCRYDKRGYGIFLRCKEFYPIYPKLCQMQMY